MLQIGIIGVMGTILAIEFQKEHREYSLLISLGLAVFIFIYILGRMEVIVETAQEIQEVMSVDIAYVEVILKMLGITYIAQFSSGICKDAGYGNIATQIDLFGKISILALSMPILLTLLQTIESFLG